VQPCLGAIYGWGVFVPALKASRSELVVMLSPDVLGVDRAAHAEVMQEYRRLKQTVCRSPRHTARSGQSQLAQFLAEVVPARVQVSDAVWAKHHYGVSGKQAQAVFSTGILVFAIVMIFAGRWQDRVGPRLVALTGGLVLAAGYAIAGIAGPSFPAVLLSIGVIGGAGIGMGYVCPIAACVKWFPDLKGIITGLAVAGFGGGAFLFIKLAGNWGGLLAPRECRRRFSPMPAFSQCWSRRGRCCCAIHPPAGNPKAGSHPIRRRGRRRLISSKDRRCARGPFSCCGWHSCSRRAAA